jgi:transposase-like protein
MANVPKSRRVFSDEFKQHIVQEIENKLVTVQTVVKTYQVAESVVYKWLRKFGTKWQPATTTVVQMESETLKRKAVQDENLQLKAMIGQQKMENDILKQVLICFNEEHKIDLKKSTNGASFSILTKTKQAIPIPSTLYYEILDVQNKLFTNIKTEQKP